MFENLDPALLVDPEFKEDSVREVVILPILTRLGYSPSGVSRVVRSKALVHPFIYAGTRKHPVTIIPDYTLFHEGKPVLVLDAKCPAENILNRENIQQAYSYAIHPEIRCQHFSLCNGKALSVYCVDQAEPLLFLPFEEFENKWATIEKYLAPRFLAEPILRNFAPDLGFKFLSIGTSKETKIVMLGVRLCTIARVSDVLMTASTNCDFQGEKHMVSFDFSPSLLHGMLAGLPSELGSAFSNALTHSPFLASADLALEVDLEVQLGEEIKADKESFVPLVVNEVMASRFNMDPVPDEPTDIPPHVFRLRKAFVVERVNR